MLDPITAKSLSDIHLNVERNLNINDGQYSPGAGHGLCGVDMSIVLFPPCTLHSEFSHKYLVSEGTIL
jgi:hypothetical protein